MNVNMFRKLIKIAITCLGELSQLVSKNPNITSVVTITILIV